MIDRLIFFILLTVCIPLSAGSPSMIMVEPPTSRLSKRWIFVVDASYSIWEDPKTGVMDKFLSAYREVISYPADDLEFSIITFSDPNSEKTRGWKTASPDEFKAAEQWIMKNLGVYSYGGRAIAKALGQKLTNLTVVIITDGGFSEACWGKGFGLIYTLIKKSQIWREKNGLGPAVITTIGIENLHYTAGGKPSDEKCQAFLRKIGKEYRGGYFLVKEN